MSRIQYFVGASIDGFIATPGDGLEWLLQFDGFEGGQESYRSFIDGVGCIAMGRTTYAWLREHGPDNWPYPGLPCYVFTRHGHASPRNADITFVRGAVAEFADELRQAAQGRNVWVMGGGNLAAQFADAGLLDDLILSLVPVVLGAGKRLLPLAGPTPPLELVASRTLGRGVLELRYLLRPDGTAGGREY